MFRALIARLAAVPATPDLLLHPDLAGLSQRDLADLPLWPAPEEPADGPSPGRSLAVSARTAVPSPRGPGLSLRAARPNGAAATA